MTGNFRSTIYEFRLLAQTPALEIRDIAPPVEAAGFPLWLVAVGVALLLALAAWLTFRWMRRRPAAPPPMPGDVALAELQNAGNQVASMNPHAFSIVVSDILRRYVTAQYSLPATQQTSPEFLASLREFGRFTSAEKALLADFLDKSDLIKFARVEATQADSQALLEEAIRFVKGEAS